MTDVLIRRDQDTGLERRPCEDTEKRGPSISQGERPLGKKQPC